MALTLAAAAAVALAAAEAAVIVALIVQRRRRSAIEARTAAMLNAVPDLMFVQDRDGVYLDYHATQQSELLVPPETFVGRNMRDVLPPDFLTIVEPLFARVWTSDEPVSGEYSLELNGVRRYYEVRFFRYLTDKVLSLIREVTDRVRVEAALRASEQRYALATAAGRAGVWDWNLDTGHIYVDPRLKALLGFEDREIANEIDDWMLRIHPDDRPLVTARVQACMSGETQTFELDRRMLHKDGTHRWFVARGSIIYDGRTARLVGTDTDVTEQKQADEELQRMHADLERVSRLAALGEFGAAIAHELRQPLAAIVINAGTCLRLLSSEAPDTDQIRATLLDVIEAGKRADAIIRRERELYRHHTVHKRPVEINRVIKEVTMLAGARLRAGGVKLRTRLGHHLPIVHGDRIALSQVMLNLMSNAIDAMERVEPRGRVLTITTALTPEAMVQVSVRDEGVGLADVDMARMYMAAYTTKPHGTGVGLSISRTIIDAHGGRLWAAPNDGPGATFSFVVPAAAVGVAAQ